MFDAHNVLELDWESNSSYFNVGSDVLWYQI